MAHNYLMGFASLYEELNTVPLSVTGYDGQPPAIPDWLEGTLVLNGPGRYDFQRTRLRHWFDGMAMLRKFDIKGNTIFYTNRMLESQAYKYILRNGELRYREFASEPHTNLFTQLMFMLNPQFSDNTAINILNLDNRFITMADSPSWVEFDLKNLNTVGAFSFNDKLKPILTTPHPHYDFKRNTLYSYLTRYQIQPTKFGVTFYYDIFAVGQNSTTRQVLATVKTDQPAYMHSFAITENYVILVEYPMRLEKPTQILFSIKPILSDYEWSPEKGTRFIVVSKADGSVRYWQGEAFFAFHHVNAFEQGNDLVLDIACYDHKMVADEFYIEALLESQGSNITLGQLRRYTLKQGSTDASRENLLPEAAAGIEMPRTNYKEVNGRPYQYAYGISKLQDHPDDFYNAIIKVDTQKGTYRHWFPQSTPVYELPSVGSKYPDSLVPVPQSYLGEPIFVPRPGAVNEDDGVILVLVLDGYSKKSILYILSGSFDEYAHIEVPHVLPFGFHGMYFPTANV